MLAHSHYFEAGSEALENMVAVVTGRYADVHRHVWSVPEIAGGLVCWTLRLPTMPVRVVGRHYRGPGFRVMVNAMRVCDLGAAQTGNLVREALDEGERAVAWVGAPGRGQLDALQLARRELTPRSRSCPRPSLTGCPFGPDDHSGCAAAPV